MLALRRSDAEAFMEFCLKPALAWAGPMVKSRFLRIGGRLKSGDDTYQVNPAWRPFSQTAPKRDTHLPETAVPTRRRYKMAQGSVAQVFALCGSFYQ